MTNSTAPMTDGSGSSDRRVSAHSDPVDELLAQWAAQRPDLDAEWLTSAGIVNRLGRLHTIALRRLEAGLADHGLKIGEFDVLSALRRQGEPYELTPAAMIDQLFLSSGAMTNRIDRLEAAGMVDRHPDPEDGRSVLVRLTDLGRRTIDRAISSHLAAEHELLAPLDRHQQLELDRLLRTLLAGA